MSVLHPSLHRGAACVRFGQGAIACRSRCVLGNGQPLAEIGVRCLSPIQEPARRPKAAGDRQQTGHSPEEQGCSIEGLPCLPAFELWLQPEPGKAEARLDRADNIEQAISAYEQSSASEVRMYKVQE